MGPGGLARAPLCPPPHHPLRLSTVASSCSRAMPSSVPLRARFPVHSSDAPRQRAIPGAVSGLVLQRPEVLVRSAVDCTRSVSPVGAEVCLPHLPRVPAPAQAQLELIGRSPSSEVDLGRSGLSL